MLGHLVPQGTGSFDLLLDHRMLADAHDMAQHMPPPSDFMHETTSAPSDLIMGYVSQVASPNRDAFDLPVFDRVTAFSPGPISPGRYHLVFDVIFELYPYSHTALSFRN
jgi:hypothetical protein